MLMDSVLSKAREALDKWKETITVDKFIEDHIRLGLVRPMPKCYIIYYSVGDKNLDDVVWALNKVGAAKEFIVRNIGVVLVHKVLEW